VITVPFGLQVGGKVDEATSPNSALDEDGSVGKQFTSEGKVGGKIDEKVYALNHNLHVASLRSSCVVKYSPMAHRRAVVPTCVSV
jgi:hypothetical protein